MRIGLRALVLGVVVVSCLGSGVAAAGDSSFSPPPEARIWLGDWHTNQGEVRFTHLANCKTGPSYPGGEPGHPGGVCTLSGEWHQPVGAAGFGGTRVPAGWKPIQGNVYLGPRYRGEAWQGCFHVPGDGTTPPGEPCSPWQDAVISIDRQGDRFTDGFWKACALSEICTDHHPFLGHKLSGPSSTPPACAKPPGLAQDAAVNGSTCRDYVVRFAVKVDGFADSPPAKELPRELATVEIRSENAELVWDPEAKRWVPHGTLQMTTTYVDPLRRPHIQEYRSTFTMSETALYGRTEASYFQSAAKRIVRSQAVLTDVELDDPDLGGGTRWWISLAVAKKRAALKLEWIQGHGGRDDLTDKPLVWDTHRIKFATISSPR